MTAAPDLQGTGERVEALLQRFDLGLAPGEARSIAEELVRALTELYGAGLERTLEIVHAGTENPAPIFDALAADKLVASLMILHGLHPRTVEERVQVALDNVRPYLNSHEGDIEVLSVEDTVVELRLGGSCHGCPSSLGTAKLTVEKAILEAAPEIQEVRVHGVSSAVQASREDSDWIALEAHPDLERAGFATLEVAGTPVLLASDGRLVHAFRNQCPRCLRSFSGATFAWPQLACASCAQSYDVAGVGHAIETFPVSIDVRDPRRIRLALPVTA